MAWMSILQETQDKKKLLSSSMSVPAGISEATSDEMPLVHSLSNARKRWCLLHKTVYSMRALISAGKYIFPKRVLQSSSYTVIEVEPEELEHLPEINRTKLSDLVKERNLAQLLQFGGVEGILAGLETSEENGIVGDAQDIANRKQLFGSNLYWKPSEKAIHIWMRSVMEVSKDPVILILLLCGALSLGFGIKDHGLKGWSDGGSILAAVFLVILLSASSTFWPKNELNKLRQTDRNGQVNVTRQWRPQQIPIVDVVVGDIVELNIDDLVPADGLYLDGHSFIVEESAMTRGSNHVGFHRVNNPFLFSGARVVDGNAKMLVTAVGMSTLRGQIMNARNFDNNEKIHLLDKIKNLTSLVSKVGMLLALLTFGILIARYFTGHMYDDQGSRDFKSSKTNISDVFKAVVGILATPVVIAGAAKPEGLLSAVTISLAYSTKRMLAKQAFVRNLSACEAASSVTVICTDKVGMLKMTDMKVTELRIGHVLIRGAPSSVSRDVLEVLHQGIGFNQTQDPMASSFDLSERVIYQWAVEEMCMNVEELINSCDVIHVGAFSTDKKQTGVLIRKKADNTLHVHLKGTPEKILAACSHYYDITGMVKIINDGARLKFKKEIQDMAMNGLMCIAYAHKQKANDDDDDESSPPKLVEESLTLVGFMCLRDPRQQAVTDCQRAGVDFKMITEDDMPTAKAVAMECGIIESNDDNASSEVIEGMEFENLTLEERMERVDQIRVIANGSHRHKVLMVQCLKSKGHVVAVTGNVSGDAMALREADIGISMGTHCSDTVNESSDVVILDGNVVSLVKFLMWARGRYHIVQKFTEFHLTVSVASLVTDCVSAISAGQPLTINIIAAISAGKVPYATLQLLWVKLIAGSLATMAMAIEQPGKEVTKNPPVNRDEPLITNIMWRNMLAQATYQIAVLLTIQFHGKTIFPAKIKDTMVFNTFVLFQIFMILSPRKFKNILRGKEGEILRSGILGAIIILQVVMVEFLKRYADTERLGWRHWGVCTGLAAGSWLVGWIVEYIPVPKKPFSTYFRRQNMNYRHL